MKKAFLFLLIFASLFLTTGVVSYVHASTCDANSDATNIYGYNSAGANCPPTLSQVANIVAVIINAILAISVLVFFIVTAVNGFNFITSLGSPDKIESARKGLLFSVVGFALIFLSFVFMNIIINVTKLSGGISIGTNGNIQFNLINSITPTSIPNITNTATPTTSP